MQSSERIHRGLFIVVLVVFMIIFFTIVFQRRISKRPGKRLCELLDLKRGDEMFAREQPRIRIGSADYHVADAGSAWPEWRPDEDAYVHPHDAALEAFLKNQGIPYQIDGTVPDAMWHDRRQQLEAVKRWYFGNWVRLEPRLRSSIVEGIVVFLSLFDDNPRVKHTFCPPKDTYDPAANPDGIHGIPLPPLAELIEQGKVIALNFPIAMNPGLASLWQTRSWSQSILPS